MICREMPPNHKVSAAKLQKDNSLCALCASNERSEWAVNIFKTLLWVVIDFSPGLEGFFK
jgi:hypothetical protein